jgi:hypothetical protein
MEVLVAKGVPLVLGGPAENKFVPGEVVDNYNARKDYICYDCERRVKDTNHPPTQSVFCTWCRHVVCGPCYRFRHNIVRAGLTTGRRSHICRLLGPNGVITPNYKEPLKSPFSVEIEELQ